MAGRIEKRLSYPQASAWAEPAWSASYDDDNRQTSVAGVALSYDADGNLLGSKLPDGPWGAGGSSSGASGTYTWNARNQLTRVVRGDNGQQIDHTYDAEGNLIQTVDSVAGTTRWIVDPNGGEHSRVLAKVAPNGDVTRYIYGVGLVYEVRQDGSVRTYHYDQVGSTVALTDASGAVTGRADYSPYGALQSTSGELATQGVTPFMFVGTFGVITDSATGLHQMRARWYSSYTRRFLSEDPTGFAGGENFYAYASGNPISLVDPSGFRPQRNSRGADLLSSAGHIVSTTLELIVPGQIAWNNGTRLMANGQTGQGLIAMGAGLAEAGASTLLSSELLVSKGTSLIANVIRNNTGKSVMQFEEISSHELSSLTSKAAKDWIKGKTNEIPSLSDLQRLREIARRAVDAGKQSATNPVQSQRLKKIDEAINNKR